VRIDRVSVCGSGVTAAAVLLLLHTAQRPDHHKRRKMADLTCTLAGSTGLVVSAVLHRQPQAD
jgi:hypothetical protein